MQDIRKNIGIAAGRSQAELVLKNCNIVNVFTEEIIEGDIAINGGYIMGIGEYEGVEEINMNWDYVAPGLIDSHVHIESSMVTPGQFAKAVMPSGTTSIIADPHEIANVLGLDGIQYILDESEDIPLDIYIMLPSCVPATSFENAGAVLLAEDLKKMIKYERILGLGELMDFPSVINADQKVLDKISIAQSKLIDGHGPGLKDKDLNAYVVSGIRTDHECSKISEMLDRLRLGMYVQIREGSAARNLDTLISKVTKENLRRVIFCTDDKHPGDILKEGHIDHSIRKAVKNGIDMITAIKIATLNAAECYRLFDKGAIAPGYVADLIVFDDLRKFNINKVFKNGELVAKNSKPLFEAKTKLNHKLTDTVKIKPVNEADLKIMLDDDIVNVIRLLPRNLVTEKVIRKVAVHNGEFIHDPRLDILKLAVIERHNATGNIGLGLVENFRLKSGALASTVAHDSHNIIVVGSNDADMLLAIKEIERIGGGLTLVDKGKVLKSLSLPIAGLMSDKPMKEMDQNINELLNLAFEKGVYKELDPFMTLSFLSLPVIPEIKLTDKGLFDVSKFDFIGLSEIESNSGV